MNHYWKDLDHMASDAMKKKNMDMRFGIKDIKLDRYGNIISFNKYKRGQYEEVDEALIAEAGDMCSVNRGDLKSKTMQTAWDKKCGTGTPKKKKKSIFGKAAKGLNLYNQSEEKRLVVLDNF